MNKWDYYSMSILMGIALLPMFLLTSFTKKTIWPLVVIFYLPDFGLITIVFLIFGAIFLWLKYKKEHIPLGAILEFKKGFWRALFQTLLLFALFCIAAVIGWAESVHFSLNLPAYLLFILVFCNIYLFLNALSFLIHVEKQWIYPTYLKSILLYFLVYPLLVVFILIKQNILFFF